MQLSHLRGRKLGVSFPFLSLGTSTFALLPCSPAGAAHTSRRVWPQNQSSLVASGSSGREVVAAQPPAPPPPGSGPKGPGSEHLGPQGSHPAFPGRPPSGREHGLAAPGLPTWARFWRTETVPRRLAKRFGFILDSLGPGSSLPSGQTRALVYRLPKLLQALAPLLSFGQKRG